MKVVACFKVVPDDQDIAVGADGSLDVSRAKLTISAYDLNAVEAAVQLVEANGGSCTVLTVGPASIDDSKLKKNILSRGADDLIMVADDACADMDTHQTACALAAAIKQVGDVDLVLFGDGSADIYAQQVGIQVGALLGVPTVNCAAGLALDGDALTVERALEDQTETLIVPLPAVVCVTSDINLPRIAGMKQILAAGKKPQSVIGADAIGGAVAPTIEVLGLSAPQQGDRRRDIVTGDSPDAIAQFADKLREAL